MNTEKIEKLKKSLSNPKIPADLKPKIEAEIKRLEDLDAKSSPEPKEEEKPVAKTRKPRTTKPVAKKTTARKPSETSKPKRTAMSVAKEIRKDGESWKDAMARASKMMKEKSKTATKDVETELQKLTKLVRGEKNKEKVSRVSDTNLKRDASRKAKPLGARKVTRSGETSNQYGTYKNHLGRKYVENRDKHGDRLAPRYPKNAPLLAEGGYLTDPTFGNFQNTMFADGGGIPNNYKGKTPEEVWNMWTEKQKQHFLVDHFNHFIVEEFKGKNLIDISRLEYKKLPLRVRLELDFHVNKGQYAKGGGIRRKNGQTYDYGRVWTNDHNQFDKGADHEVEYRRKKRFELGGSVVTDLAGHTGGALGTGDPSLLSGVSGTSYTGLVGETGAMSSGEMFAKGGDIPFQNSNLYLIGKGRDVNGNKIIKVSFPNQRAFSIQTLGNLPKTHDILRVHDKIEDISPNDVKIIEKEVLEYVSEFGSDKQKKSLKKYELGGGLPSGVSQPYMITESFGNPAQHYAKGGGIRRKNGQTYDYGRVWTNDHNQFDKGADHEVNYRKKDKFMGIFADGGEIYAIAENMSDDDYNKKYNNLTEKQKNKVQTLIRLGDMPKLALATVLYGNYENDYDSDTYKLYTMAKGGDVDDESPKIYVADLEAYNNGRLSGVWLDLADYNDADELMEAINDFLKTTGGEEYAIHDVENIPNSMYSEYMGQKDFEELYEMIDLAKENDLPLSVVQEVVSQYDASAIDEFQGRYDDAEDFAQQLVDDLGIESFTDFQYYLDISDTDRRLLSQDMADSYVENIVDEDGGNRIIEEAGLDVEEYEEADSDRQEEMIDEAREIVYDEYYNTWFEGLSDPYYFLVEEQGMYSAEDFANADFVRIDFEKLADALEQDYTFIYDGGSLYVFNIR